MKILVVHNDSPSGFPSGEKVVFENEALALRQLGLDVHTHLAQRGAGLTGKLRQANVFWSKRSYDTMRDLLRTIGPDIVHFHGVLPDLTASAFAACRAAGVPTVQTLHNYRWLCVEGGLFRNAAYCDDCITKNSWHGLKHRCSRGSLIASGLLTLNNRVVAHPKRLLRGVDRFLAVSQFVKDRYVAGGFPAEKIVVKSNGVKLPDDTADFQADSMQGIPTITFVGRLDIAKGTPVLNELPKLLGSRCDVQFRIVGNGPAESSLRESLLTHRNVEFLGRVPSEQVAKVIRHSHCVIVPSLVPETFGLVAAESLAAGVPVIASRIGGLTELIDASQGGVLVSPEEGASGFADAIERLLKNKDQLPLIGKKGRQFAEERLRIEITTEKLVDVYQSLLAGRHRPLT